MAPQNAEVFHESQITACRSAATAMSRVAIIRSCRCNARSTGCSTTSPAGSRRFPAAAAAELLPNVDVTETDKQIEITAELPGLEEKDVQVNVADNVLTIRGEKKAEKEEKDKTLPAGRAQLRFFRAFARIAGRRQCRCHQGQHRQRRAQGDGAEAGAGASEKDRRQGRRLVPGASIEARPRGPCGAGARLFFLLFLTLRRHGSVSA